MKDVKERIIDEIRGNIPENTVHDIEMLIREEKYRWAFAELQKIKKSNQWQPTKEYLFLLEKFWCLYAN